jgi:hypothetical protein
MPTPINALRFYSGKHYACWITRDGIHTTLSDGYSCFGLPLDAPQFRTSAEQLGYGNDIYQHIVEHDLLHNYLSEKFRNSHSHSIWAQCHNREAFKKIIPPAAREEEDFVAAMQAALNRKDWGFKQLRNWITSHRVGEVVGETAFLLRPHNRPMTRQWADSTTPIQKVTS